MLGIVIAAIVVGVWELRRALAAGLDPRAAGAEPGRQREHAGVRLRRRRRGPDHHRRADLRRHPAVADRRRRARRACATSPVASSSRSTRRFLAGFAALMLAGRRRRPADRRVHPRHGAQRRRRLRLRGAAGQAPDGPLGQPQEVLGGLRRLGAHLRRRWRVVVRARCSTGPGGAVPLLGAVRGGRGDAWATSPSRRSSATSASRT